jgi:ceramide glucosyltransferase
MSLLLFLFCLFLLAYGAYTCLAMAAARNWARTRFPIDPDWLPSVTILKPVRGVDQEEYDNFASFCRQDYPPERYQILFAALDAEDPALEIARQLQRDFEGIDIGIVSGGGALHGYNRKVCNLAQALPYAKHDLLIISDSDMRVTPDYLRRVLAPLQQGYSVVTCPYRGYHPRNLASIWEAIGIGADFLPSVLVSRSLEGVGFAFGSTIALSRELLAEIGGLEALKDQLADDFRIGNRAQQMGRRVALSDYMALDVLGRESFQNMWARRVRWGRTLRACRPAGYAGSLVTHGFALATLFLMASGLSPLGWKMWAGTLAFRMLTVFCITRFWTKDPAPVRYLPLLPISDLLSFCLFLLSFTGRVIAWRGERFSVRSDGSLAPVPASAPKRVPAERS